MKKIIIALIGVAVSSTGFAQIFPPLDPGGGYQITTTATGETVSDGYKGPIAPTVMWCRGTGGKTAKAFIEIEVEVSYTGTGTPPPNMFLRITPLAFASASGGIWDLETSDGTDSVEEITNGPGSEARKRVGTTLKKIRLGPDGKMKFTLKSGSIATNRSQGVMGAKAGFEIAFVDRGAEILPVSPDKTYRRAKYGVAIENKPGDQIDVGLILNLDSIPGFYQADVSSRYTLFGVASGAWENPITVETSPQPWEREMVPGGMMIHHNWRIGNVSMGSEKDRRNWLGSKFAELMSGPLQKTQVLTVSDFRGSETTRVPVYIHGPVEATGETWEDEYTGRLDLCETLMAKTDNKFLPKLIGAASHSTINGNEESTVKVTISKEFSVSTGVEIGNSYMFEFALEALKASWGQDVTVSSDQAFKLNEQIEFGITLGPGREFRLWYGAIGTAEFRTVAQYGHAGFEMDRAAINVRNLVGKHMTEVVPTNSPPIAPK